MNLNSVNHINAIINYYKENPGCDPNVYEFIQVCDEVSKDLNATSSKCGIYSNGGPKSENIRKKYPEAVLVYDTFLMFHDVFFDKFVNCGIDTYSSHPLYELCAENAYNALHYNEMTEEEAEFNKMLGGVSFYILQQQRDVRNGLNHSFKYDNYIEMDRILEYSPLVKPERTYSLF